MNQSEIAEREALTLAISVRQPWAWLIVNGYKNIENRDWPTKVRGRVLIHASQKFDDIGYMWIGRKFPDIEMLEALPFDQGGIVGEAEIVDCVRQHRSPWFMGEYGFVLRNARPLPFIPCRGRLGFFNPGNMQADG
jgi:hypothetical protein